MKPKPGEFVLLMEAPLGLLEGCCRDKTKRQFVKRLGSQFNSSDTMTMEELSWSSQTVTE